MEFSDVVCLDWYAENLYLLSKSLSIVTVLDYKRQLIMSGVSNVRSRNLFHDSGITDMVIDPRSR